MTVQLEIVQSLRAASYDRHGRYVGRANLQCEHVRISGIIGPLRPQRFRMGTLYLDTSPDLVRVSLEHRLDAEAGEAQPAVLMVPTATVC